MLRTDGGLLSLPAADREKALDPSQDGKTPCRSGMSELVRK